MLAGWNARDNAAELRRKRAESVTAYFVAHLINVQLPKKDRISVKDLTDPLHNTPAARRDKKSDAEYLKQRFPKAFRNGGENK